MASGIAVVAAGQGGTLDLVRPGVTGLLFKAASHDDLSAQVRRLIEEPDTLVAMGKAGRSMAEQHSWPMVMGDLMDHYRRALKLASGRKLVSRIG